MDGYPLGSTLRLKSGRGKSDEPGDVIQAGDVNLHPVSSHLWSWSKSENKGLGSSVIIGLGLCSELSGPWEDTHHYTKFLALDLT